MKVHGILTCTEGMGLKGLAPQRKVHEVLTWSKGGMGKEDRGEHLINKVHGILICTEGIGLKGLAPQRKVRERDPKLRVD